MVVVVGTACVRSARYSMILLFNYYNLCTTHATRSSAFEVGAA